MGQRHAALEMVHQNWLDVPLVVAAGGAVAHMAHGHGAVEALKGLLVKHLADQAHILVKGLLPVVDGRDSAGLLAPVLQGVQAVVSGLGAAALGVTHAKDAALLMKFIFYICAAFTAAFILKLLFHNILLIH